MSASALVADKLPPKHFELSLDAYGKLVLVLPDGRRVEGVLPVRSYPIQAPEQGIAMVDADGHEVAWIPQLQEVPPAQQQLIRDSLRTREFMPVIEALVSVTSFSTPCTWRVRTDRGDTQFVLRGEEDIRRLGGGNGLLITDSHGIQFYVRDLTALDRDSRRLLDRFL
ncbi:MAG: DUF1854 domain-containing protein [Hylemonella sp.]